jgi:hypothetical protein
MPENKSGSTLDLFDRVAILHANATPLPVRTYLNEFTKFIERYAKEQTEAAFHRGVEAAKGAVRAARYMGDNPDYFKATVINEIARTCGRPPECWWTFERDGFWHGECGEAYFHKANPQPVRDSVNYCHRCGRKVRTE